MLDQFLMPGASYNRLVAEYEKYGSLHVGFDFDSTVYDFHQTGESYEMVRQLLRDLTQVGCKCYCWTAQNDLAFVERFLADNNIPHEGINTGGINLGWESRKPFYSALLDDRAGLHQVYTELRMLANFALAKQGNQPSIS
jgi:hypothetical protein